MVEFGSNWDADDEFDDLLGILDFPMESLEGDGLVEEWDISNSQCLGPIPSNILMGPPTSPSKKVDAGPPHLFRGPVASIAGAQEQKQLPNHVDASSSHISQQSKSANAQESGAFETQSPISVLESSGSCLGGKSLSIKSDNAIPVRSRSKRVRPAGVNPWLLALSALSISQKTSNARRSRESRKELFQQPLAMDVIKDSAKKFESSLGISDSAHPQNGSSHRPRVKKCTRCESTTTPQWREGPLGPKSLCNACGVRYRKARRSRESRKQLFQQPVAKDVIKDPPKKSENSLGVSDCARPQNASSHRPVVVKKCTHCESTKTPQWREGPLGPKTLCNACGVRYRTGRLFPEYRPAASPTFVPSQHSNSHKKVVEMRSKAKQQEAKIEEPPISWQPKAKTEEPPRSPQPEFVPMSSYLFDYIY